MTDTDTGGVPAPQVTYTDPDTGQRAVVTLGTTGRGYPYPVDTDPTAAGAAAIQALALAIDANVGKVAAGSVTFVAPPPNTVQMLAVTFPLNRFTAVPFVVVNAQTGTPTLVGVSSGSASRTGVNIFMQRTTATSTPVHWIAIQN